MTPTPPDLRAIQWASLYDASTGHDYLVHTKAPRFCCALVIRPRMAGRDGPPWRLSDHLWWRLWPRYTFENHNAHGRATVWAFTSFVWFDRRPAGSELQALLAEAERAQRANTTAMPKAYSDPLPNAEDSTGAVARLLRIPRVIGVPVLNLEERLCCLEVAYNTKRIRPCVSELLQHLMSENPGG